jgi:hypothetical protein
MLGEGCIARATIGRDASMRSIARRACPKLMLGIFAASWTIAPICRQENKP